MNFGVESFATASDRVKVFAIRDAAPDMLKICREEYSLEIAF